MVQIEAIDTGERMNLGAQREIRPRSLLPEKEIKERQFLLKTVNLPLLLKIADIAAYRFKSLSRTPVIMKKTESVMG